MPLPFAACSRGNIALFSAIGIAALLSASGAAIDYSRWNSTQAELYAALDSAVLAGTKALSEEGVEAKATKVAKGYFDNVIGDKSRFSTLDISFKLNESKTGIAAAGTAEIKTSFLGLFGLPVVPLVSPGDAELVSAESQPPGGAEIVEVSLMLDVTGSMCDNGVGPCGSGSKISALKSAANSLVDQLFPNSGSAGTKNVTKVAIVPFSTRVRLAPDGAGGGIMKAVTNLDPTWTGYYDQCLTSTGGGGSEDSGNWVCTSQAIKQLTNEKIMPCVSDRFYRASNSFDFSDAPPGPGRWLNAHGGDRMPFWRDSTDSPATSERGVTAADPAYHWNYDGSGGCADIENTNKVVPLTDSKSTLQGSINGLRAYGATAGVLGTSFAWYTIAPSWGDIWGGDSAPRPYSELDETGSTGAKKLRKVAVLMTDGAYNTHVTSKGTDIGMLSNAAQSVCANMKSVGIEVFAIGFSLNSLTSSEAGYARDTLTNCASDASHYVEASSSVELVNAFDSIASELVASNIRLIK